MLLVNFAVERELRRITRLCSARSCGRNNHKGIFRCKVKPAQKLKGNGLEYRKYSNRKFKNISSDLQQPNKFPFYLNLLCLFCICEKKLGRGSILVKYFRQTKVKNISHRNMVGNAVTDTEFRYFRF